MITKKQLEKIYEYWNKENWEHMRKEYPEITDKGWVWLTANDDRAAAFGLGVMAVSNKVVKRIEAIQRSHGWLDEKKEG